MQKLLGIHCAGNVISHSSGVLKGKGVLYFLLAILVVFSLSTPVIPQAFANEAESSGTDRTDQMIIEPAGMEVSSDVQPASVGPAIVLQTLEPGTLKISNKWSTSIIVAQEGKPETVVEAGSSIERLVTTSQMIIVRESAIGATFRTWKYTPEPFVSGIRCSVTSISPMSAFTTDTAGTTAGDDFFSCFNFGGTLVSLPAGSFNTSSITTVGNGFFTAFNSGQYGGGYLTALPAGSFDISNITVAKDSFFGSSVVCVGRKQT